MSSKIAHYRDWVITASARPIELSSGRRIYEGHATLEKLIGALEESAQADQEAMLPRTYAVKGVFHTPLAAKNAVISVAKRGIDFM